MLSKVLFSALLFFGLLADTAAQPDQYIITLKDKAGSAFSIDKPQQFLSQRAIDRRKNEKISIVENDVPVSTRYIDSIRLSGNVVIKNTSKWLNQVLIETDDNAALARIAAMPFVSGKKQVKRQAASTSPDRKFEKLLPLPNISRQQNVAGLSYGLSAGQVKIHNGQYLHDKNFKGQGMLIAVIDAGFYHYKTLPAFDSIRLNNQILETYDFVENKAEVNDSHEHGMSCLSLIAANVPGTMIGTAPGATFLLYRSENVYAEYPGELQNWIAAAERSDSAGADIITTSLGYNTFDNPAFDFTYQNMDGRTTMMARAADIAASKGIVLLVAAGNEGNKPWHYITTPGDAADVLTVAAVNVDGNPAPFSSYGPTADHRIKPDVASVGWLALVQAPGGSFTYGNGTSYATPNLAGLVACLWQAFPDFNSTELMDVIKKSSNSYASPGDRLGYGIPDFEKAYETLATLRLQRNKEATLGSKPILIFPNPAGADATLLLRAPATGKAVMQWFDASGRLCYKQEEDFVQDEIKTIKLGVNRLPRGTYTVQIQINNRKYSSRILIQ